MKIQDNEKKGTTKSAPNIEVGTGAAFSKSSYAAGREAASLAIAGIGSHPLSAVFVFASALYHLDEMLSGIRSVVGEAPVFGASSVGEICGRIFSGSVVVMALASPYLSVRMGLGKSVSADWRKAVQEAAGTEEMKRYFSPQDSSYYNELTREGRSAFAVLFSPGSTAGSDSYSPEILEELQCLSHGYIPFFGGSAVDPSETTGRENFVFYGNSAHSDSMVLAVFETSLKFGIAMGHGFHPTAKKAVVTKARNCEVLELDGKPAAAVFAALHDLPGGSRDEHLLFREKIVNPFGMRHSLGQYTIFVPKRFTPEGGLLLAHPAKEGSSLVLMETIEDEVVAAGKDTLQRAMTQSGIAEPAAIVICSCFLRRNRLKDRFDDEITTITDIMPGVPVAGFYGAGEQGTNADHVSRHNNETMVILLLGNDLSFAAQVAEENRNLHRMLEVRLAEQKRLEADLAEQIHFLQTLIDTIPSPVFYKDQEGKYLGCNKAYEEYSGISRQVILGKSNQDLLPQDEAELHTRRDAELAEQGGNIQYECTLSSHNGRHFHVLDNKAVFHRSDGSRGGIVGVLVDITDLKKTEEALRASEEKFLKAFHNNPTMMLITTVEEGRIIEANESFLQHTGATRQEILEKTTQEFQTYYHQEHRNLVIKAIEETGSVRNLDIPLRTKNGDVRQFLLSAEQIHLHNGNHLLVLLQDITDQKQAEAERLQRLQLEGALDMAATMCHEFNQPIQVLSGYTELLLSDRTLDAKVQKKLQIIKEQTSRMEMITRKLLNIRNCSVRDYAGIGRIMDIHEDKGEGLDNHRLTILP